MKIAHLLLFASLGVAPLWHSISNGDENGDKIAFFEEKIRPVLVKHCYECHSAATSEIKGGLQLDYRDGLVKGGESGPGIVQGKPAESGLIAALRWETVEMPPSGKLPDSVIRDFEVWVEMGAIDPRDTPPTVTDAAEESWKATLAERSQWWSLQSPRPCEPPVVADRAWMKDPVDRFIRAKLESEGISPARVASADVLLRRLFFVLTGLPPSASEVVEFKAAWEQDADAAYVKVVDSLLESPHFGERFARHWMDVIRYTDTYGYEWDIQAKGSWEFRDYLIRAFNQDVGFDQLIKEQVAGDLLPQPRIDSATGTYESIIGPMFFHFGERRHGSSLDFNGVHQEMIDSQIDAFSKALLGMTVACARCHDHKLDAVSQRDYYALASVFMTPRWTTRCIDTPEKYQSQIAEMVRLRTEIQRAMGTKWYRQIIDKDIDLDAVVRSVVGKTQSEGAIEGISYPLIKLFREKSWTFPQKLKALAEHKATKLIVEADGVTVKATGEQVPEIDAYSTEFITSSGEFSTLRLEALTDSSLGSNGPGRTPHGNFVLSHIRVFVKASSESEKRELKLVSATADYEQPGYPVAAAITEPSDGWGIGLGGNVNRSAEFRFENPVSVGEGAIWSVEMRFGLGSGHNLGRYRFSVGKDTIQGAAADNILQERWNYLAEQWRSESERRRLHNQLFTNLMDSGEASLPDDWTIDGNGLANGWVSEATPLVSLMDDSVFSRILPRGLHSHALSPKLSGALRLPEPERFSKKFVSLFIEGGEWAGFRSIPQNAFLNEGPAFFDPNSGPTWFSFTTTPLRHGVTRMLTEISTADLNANFPPRTGVARMGQFALPNEDSGFDKQSWFSLTSIVAHDQPGQPLDGLHCFKSLYDNEVGTESLSVKERIVRWWADVVQRFAEGKSEEGDAKTLNWLLENKVLGNRVEQDPDLGSLIKRYRAIEATLDLPRSVNSMDERGVAPIDYKLNVRGDVHSEGDAIARDFLEVMATQAKVRHAKGSGRLELAEYLGSRDNPQTARVYVNRLWQWVFGKGIVDTPNDFGKLGARPSHPELLDWLALQFMEEGWSTKRLIRRLVLSETFRQSGEVSLRGSEVDPTNRYLHYYPTRRLEAESIRDNLLAVAGRIDKSLYGRPIRPQRPKEDAQKRLFSGPLDGNGRRSIYLEMSVMQPPEFLVGFNLPDLKFPAGQRDVTNVPAQALILLNHPFVLEMAKAWGGQLLRDGAQLPEERIEAMFLQAYGRRPEQEELQQWLAAARDLAGGRDNMLNDRAVWDNLAHAMFNTKEFLYYR